MVLGAALALLRRRSGLEGIAAGLLTLLIAAWLYRGGAAPHPPDGPSRVLTLAVYNAKGEDSRGDQSLDVWLRGVDADIVCLIDSPWGFASSEDWIRARYPHSVEPEMGMWWPTVILSKHPLQAAPLSEADEDTFSFAARRSVLIAPDGLEPFLLTAMHPLSPRTAETWRESLVKTRREATLIRAGRERLGVEAIAAGDFNSTPAGRLHRLFHRTSGLRTRGSVFGDGTWPAWASPTVALPIDRVWASGGIGLGPVQVGPQMQSDHRPILVELRLREAPQANSAPGPDDADSD
ncbi:MAG: endonuclease/exonuclease/phosphatase family protein [Planctomycetota bacterium]|nr:endonuclease/exonuclease/phosphatase family protein [Planctomycetota bacterium]